MKAEQTSISPPQPGEFSDGGIRYMLIRPDVLMGLGRELVEVGPGVFLNALEKSAFVNGMRSFEHYREQGRFEGSDALQSTCSIAASLGWGEWAVLEQSDGTRLIDVRNSPFAAGFGASTIPVCAPIVGILKALTAVFPGLAGQVEEIACCSQGADVCRFHLR
ncbi:MAG: 4-vinyl reductase [Pseudomonadota bacterium]|nr:4-vinyl reductase [Pseudomonadota bacterium]